ncbi:MAG TPA: 16S rRNA (guanine(527)-N(7))-methyltransferase RsmG [Clostridia bacterium]|nr:16S rRNA (guanine(527)-N(7))-methyltransferase RsmG [Clostridia bacterium]
MDTAHIVELVAPYLGDANTLTSEQAENISTYVNILMKWNARMNLTAVRTRDEMISRHFGESLFAARHLLSADSRCSVIDVGSGAGFPGLVLKIFAPGLSLMLVESQNKKATFLKEIVRQLSLSDVEVLNVRAEKVGLRAELVTFRAVEKFESIAPTAARLVSPGGRLAMLIGSAQVQAAHQFVPGAWQLPIMVPGSAARVLAVCRPKLAS